VRPQDPNSRKTFVALSHVLLIDREIRRENKHKRYPSRASLARTLETSSKTIQRRLQFMRDMLDAPLAYDESKKGWFYTEKHWRAPNITLKNREMVALDLACKAALYYPNAPWAGDLRKLFLKLTDGLGNSVQIDADARGLPVHIGHAPISQVEPGVLSKMLMAIEQRRTVDMTYYVVDRDEVTTRTVEPYMLRASRGVWYVVGHDHLRDQARVFNLSRVRKLKLGKKRWDMERYAAFDPEEFYKNALFASAGKEPEKIVLEFTGAPARIVAEFVWHPSQQLKRNSKNRTTLTLEVVDHDELRGWILGWGSSCKVKQPAALARAIAAEHQSAAANYRGG